MAVDISRLYSLIPGEFLSILVEIELRHARTERMGTFPFGYADLDAIKRELAYAYRLFNRRRDWPLVYVTSNPIKETASEVVSLLGKESKAESDWCFVEEFVGAFFNIGIARSITPRYNVARSIGAWRSPASALAWGARGPGFNSRRPD